MKPTLLDHNSATRLSEASELNAFNSSLEASGSEKTKELAISLATATIIKNPISLIENAWISQKKNS